MLKLADREYLVIKEVAAILGVSRATIYTWIKKGKLSYVTHPASGQLRFKRSVVEKLAKFNK